MKKLLFKVAAMLVIVLGMSNYMMYIMTGKMPFSADSVSLPSLPGSDATSILPAQKETVYKWVDENGELHYSSEPPPELAKAEKMEVDPNVNMIQGLRMEEKAESEPEPAPQPQVNLPQGNIYNPQNVQKLIEDAQNVQTLLNDRYKDLEQQ